MSKNKIITTLIVCAILCSVLAGYLIYRFLTPQRGTIYVFNGAYEVGEQISEDMLTPIQVDATILVNGRRDGVGSQFVTPADYGEVVRSGDSLRMDVNEGMPLTTTMLSVQGGSSVEMNMKSDAVAVTVPVDAFSGITNELKDGSRVNVYSTINDVTVLIQQNKRVLEVFRAEGEITGVSLEEDIQESMELISAMSTGKVYLGLVDATGYQATEGDDPYYVNDVSKYYPQDDVYDDATYQSFLASMAESETEYAETEYQTETPVETEPATEYQMKEGGEDAVFVPNP